MTLNLLKSVALDLRLSSSDTVNLRSKKSIEDDGLSKRGLGVVFECDRRLYLALLDEFRYDFVVLLVSLPDLLSYVVGFQTKVEVDVPGPNQLLVEVLFGLVEESLGGLYPLARVGWRFADLEGVDLLELGLHLLLLLLQERLPLVVEKVILVLDCGRLRLYLHALDLSRLGLRLYAFMFFGLLPSVVYLLRPLGVKPLRLTGVLSPDARLLGRLLSTVVGIRQQKLLEFCHIVSYPS